MIKKREEGYIALFSTIILIAVFLLLFTGMFLIAVGGMSRISSKEKYLKSFSWANQCMEIGLNDLRSNPGAFIGDISKGAVNDGCEISDLERFSEKILAFKSIGTFDDHIVTFQLDIEVDEDDTRRLIKITGWYEELEIVN